MKYSNDPKLETTYKGPILDKTDIIIEMCKQVSEETTKEIREKNFALMKKVLENVIERYMEYRWNILE